jgi:hypothetical protein
MTTELIESINLRTRALLVTLNISVWNPKKTDRAATLETLIAKGASRDAGSFVKNLLPDGAIDAVKKAEGKLRRMVYDQTLPWRDDGIRILPIAMWEDFAASERATKEEFNKAVGQFLLDYDQHRAKAKIALNGLFNEADYPSVEVVRQKFSVRISWFPMPDGADFRVDLPEDVRQQISAEMDQGVEESILGAQQELHTRLSSALTAVVDRLKEPDTIFRNSLITNLRGLCEQLPKLMTAGRQANKARLHLGRL